MWNQLDFAICCWRALPALHSKIHPKQQPTSVWCWSLKRRALIRWMLAESDCDMMLPDHYNCWYNYICMLVSLYKVCRPGHGGTDPPVGPPPPPPPQEIFFESLSTEYANFTLDILRQKNDPPLHPHEIFFMPHKISAAQVWVRWARTGEQPAASYKRALSSSFLSSAGVFVQKGCVLCSVTWGKMTAYWHSGFLLSLLHGSCHLLSSSIGPTVSQV